MGEINLPESGGWFSLGDCIDSIDNSREVAEDSKNQTDPELDLRNQVMMDDVDERERERRRRENE